MNRFALTSVAAVFLSSVVGCAGIETNRSAGSSEEVVRVGNYCHKVLEPVGNGVAPRAQPAPGDTTDFYGPCDGPSLSDRIQQQKRFESFRFGREYMDEG